MIFKAFNCFHFIEGCSSQKTKEGTINLDLLGMGCMATDDSSQTTGCAGSILASGRTPNPLHQVCSPKKAKAEGTWEPCRAGPVSGACCISGRSRQALPEPLLGHNL